MACYNFDKHEPILTIFGSNVALKVSNQKMFFFHLAQIVLLHLPCKMPNHKTACFTQML